MAKEDDDDINRGVIARFLNEDDLTVLFAGFALMGVSGNLQLKPDEAAAHAVKLGQMSAETFIQSGLLPGVAPKVDFKAMMKAAQSGANPKDYIAQMQDLAKRQGVKGIPGDGTFPKNGG